MLFSINTIPVITVAGGYAVASGQLWRCCMISRILSFLDDAFFCFIIVRYCVLYVAYVGFHVSKLRRCYLSKVKVTTCPLLWSWTTLDTRTYMLHFLLNIWVTGDGVLAMYWEEAAEEVERMKERIGEGERPLRISFQSTHTFFHIAPRLNEWPVWFNPGPYEVRRHSIIICLSILVYLVLEHPLCSSNVDCALGVHPSSSYNISYDMYIDHSVLQLWNALLFSLSLSVVTRREIVCHLFDLIRE